MMMILMMIYRYICPIFPIRLQRLHDHRADRTASMMNKHPLVQMLAVMMTMTMLLLLHMTCADEFLTETAQRIIFRTLYCFLMSTLLYVILILIFKVIISNHLLNDPTGQKMYPAQITKFAHVSVSLYPLVAICWGLSLARQITNSGQRLCLPKIHPFLAYCKPKIHPFLARYKPKIHDFLAYHKPKIHQYVPHFVMMLMMMM